MKKKFFIISYQDTSPGTKDLGPDHFVVTGLFQGKFTLTDDGKAMGQTKHVKITVLLGVETLLATAHIKQERLVLEDISAIVAVKRSVIVQTLSIIIFVKMNVLLI